MSKLKNPCIGHCCLTPNDICLGCFRSLDEILSWSKMSLSEKQTTLKKCKVRKQQQYAKKDFDS